MTIYAVGLDNDKTLLRFITTAMDAGADVSLVNLHAVAREGWRLMIPAAHGQSVVYGDGDSLTLDPGAGYYMRLVDLSPVLPEPASGAWRSMVTAFSAFLETVTGPVVNRPGSQAHNAAKPLHEWWLSQRGFQVPGAITSSDRTAIQAFLARHGQGIVKALSGMRGTAQIVTAESFDHFEPIQGPVHVQQYVSGYDVRVHAVGNDIHAEKIESDAVDYRDRGVASKHTATTIPDELAQRIVSASAEMGLAFTGWDFKVDAEGRFWCLEANPMPGYDVYDRRCGGNITRSIVEYLTP